MKDSTYNSGKSRTRGARFFTKRNTFTDMKLNDFENDLHIMNFKLNCDILQHKLSRLNSLIQVSDINKSLNSIFVDDDINKLSTSLNTVSTVNIVNTYNTLNRISTPNGLKARNMKNINFPDNSHLDSLLTNTKDLSSKYSKTVNKEEKKPINIRYNDKIKHLLNTNLENDTNSKLMNLGETNDSYENMYTNNQNYINSNQKRNNKPFKRNKDLMINTSLSSQYLAESVQRFCITPVTENRLNINDTTNEIDNDLPQFAINNVDKLSQTNNLSSNLENLEKSKESQLKNNTNNSDMLSDQVNSGIISSTNYINNKNEVVVPAENSSTSEDLSNIADNLVNFIQEENEENLDISIDDKMMNTGRLFQELKGNSYTTMYDASQSNKQIEPSNSELFTQNKFNDLKKTTNINEIANSESDMNFTHTNQIDIVNSIPQNEDEIKESNLNLISEDTIITNNAPKTEIIPDNNLTNEEDLKESKHDNSIQEQDEEETDEDADRIINEIIKNSQIEQTKIIDRIVPKDNKNVTINESRNIIQNFNEESFVSKKRKITLEGTTAIIGYNEKDIVKNLYISKGEGKYEKFKNTDFKNYLKTLKSKFTPKSILKAKDEKSLALEKLNDLILECESGTLDEKGKRTYTCVSRDPPTEIMVRNIKKVQEIETLRKQGVNYRKTRVPTPRKPKKIEFCDKFKKNPAKFFSEPLCDLELRSLEIKVDNNLFRSTDFNSNLNSSTQPFESDSLAFMDRVSRSVELSPKQKEGKLKEYISNITIQNA